MPRRKPTRARSTDAPGFSQTARSNGGRWFWICAALAGIGLRVGLVTLSPKYGYFPDHDDFVRWGIQATDKGLTTLYEQPPELRDARKWNGSEWVIRQRSLQRLCNYPPLSTYLLYTSGLVFRSVSHDRLINTYTARIVFSGWSILADLLLAWGCAALVARFVSRPAARWTYMIVLFAPPIWWDSSIWGQMDALLLAPSVWMVFFMSTGRWKSAGLMYGLAAALKPQAVLFLPVWALALVITRPVWKPALSILMAVGVVLVTALPFLFDSGWAWLRLSYIENLLQAYAVTTLKAFNFWYLELLLSGSKDAMIEWSGVAKDVWGKAALCAGLAGGFALMTWRWRRDARAFLLWSGLCLLMFVMLPTRVHERYLVLAVPFLIVASMFWRRFRPATIALVIVATAQVTWPGWLTTPAGDWAAFERKRTVQYEQWLESVPTSRRNEAPSLEETLEKPRREYLARRSQVVVYEWLFTLMSVVAFLNVLGTALSLKPEEPGTGKLRREPPVP